MRSFLRARCLPLLPLWVSLLLSLFPPGIGTVEGQSVTLPKEVKGEPGAWIVVVPESKEGGEVKWKVGTGLTLVPLDKLFPGQKSAGIVVQGQKGRYEVWAWNAKEDKASDLAVTTIIIGDAPIPPVPPGPGPNPPTPPDPPPNPAPIEGRRILILYESADETKYPEGQRRILFTRDMRGFMDTLCDTEDDGTKGWKIWDKDSQSTKKVWQDALKRPRASTAMPWVILGNGKTGYEGPLPANPEEFRKLLTQYMVPTQVIPSQSKSK